MSSTQTPPSGSTQFCTNCGQGFPPDDLVRFGDQLICANCKPRFVQQMREGVSATGTFVYGGFWRRFVAILLDWIILLVVLAPLQFLLLPRSGVASYASLSIIGLTSFAVQIGIAMAYEVYFVSHKSATPGKMIMGMKVITPDGGPISVGRSFGRYFGKLLSSFTLTIGYIIAGFDSQKRALHDYLAGTRVVRTS